MAMSVRGETGLPPAYREGSLLRGQRVCARVLPPAPFHRGMGSRAGGIRTHVGSVGNHTHPASRIAVGATRHPFCARKSGRACLSGPIVCSFAPTPASREAEGFPFGSPKHIFGLIKHNHAEPPAIARRA